MNPKLYDLFCLYRYLRSCQEIVEEIVTLDYYVENYNEELAIKLIDFCVTKYNKEIKQIGFIYQSKVVVEDDPDLYEKKDSVEINSDVAYIRDCLMIIGAVKSGIRPSIADVVEEIER